MQGITQQTQHLGHCNYHITFIAFLNHSVTFFKHPLLMRISYKLKKTQKMPERGSVHMTIMSQSGLMASVGKCNSYDESEKPKNSINILPGEYRANP